MSKEKTLSLRISEKTYDFLKSLSGKGNVSDVAREKIETALMLPDFKETATKLLASPSESFISILKRYLEHESPVGRCDYLFLARKIQNGSLCRGISVNRERFLGLLELQEELYCLYKGGFPDDHYLLSNLTGYVGSVDNVLKALKALIASIDSIRTDSKTYSVDLIFRNIIVLLENSSNISEDTIRKKLAPYLDTFITLGSKAICRDNPVPIELFSSYFFLDFSVTEEGNWFSLRVISNSSSFWAVLETKGSPSLVIPLGYPAFALLTTPDKLSQVPKSEDFMLHLPAGARLFLDKGQADVLRKACEKIRSMPQFKTHDWILSLLYGVAD